MLILIFDQLALVSYFFVILSSATLSPLLLNFYLLFLSLNFSFTLVLFSFVLWIFFSFYATIFCILYVITFITYSYQYYNTSSAFHLMMWTYRLVSSQFCGCEWVSCTQRSRFLNQYLTWVYSCVVKGVEAFKTDIRQLNRRSRRLHCRRPPSVPFHWRRLRRLLSRSHTWLCIHSTPKIGMDDNKKLGKILFVYA